MILLLLMKPNLYKKPIFIPVPELLSEAKKNKPFFRESRTYGRTLFPLWRWKNHNILKIITLTA